jgi:uncharacterized protein YbjT (DUF2867 family)
MTSVLIISPTGKQASAVVDHLLSGDHGEFDVRALSSHPESDACQLFADRGATIIEGNPLDKNTLEPAIEEVDAVYCAANVYADSKESEVMQATNVAQVAATGGVTQFVFSSIGRAEHGVSIPTNDPRYEIEQHINELDLPATIIRPAFFMQNFEDLREAIMDGRLELPLAEDIPLQMVDIDNIGALAAEVLADPDRYVGETIELASDEQTLEEMAEIFTEMTDRTVDAWHSPHKTAPDEIGLADGIISVWFHRYEHEADIEALQRKHDIELTQLDEYLREHDWAQ